jgi:hypothetical protein
MDSDIHLEKFENQSCPYYPLFLQKLKELEKIADYSYGYYRLGNLVWMAKRENYKYPSEYFRKVVLSTQIVQGYLLNPPLILSADQRQNYTTVPLKRNQLLILDALFEQGGRPHYQNNNYAEHAGAILVDPLDPREIENILVFTHFRTSPTDPEILLPRDYPKMYSYYYIFHTHPYDTFRRIQGILYELPSSNDLYIYHKYHQYGHLISSLIIAPEGLYVIRPRNATQMTTWYDLTDRFLELEKKSYTRMKIKNIHPLDHKKIYYHFKTIQEYNDLISHMNIYVEYYPREWKHNRWMLRDIDLHFFR